MGWWWDGGGVRLLDLLLAASQPPTPALPAHAPARPGPACVAPHPAASSQRPHIIPESLRRERCLDGCVLQGRTGPRVGARLLERHASGSGRAESGAAGSRLMSAAHAASGGGGGARAGALPHRNAFVIGYQISAAVQDQLAAVHLCSLGVVAAVAVHQVHSSCGDERGGEASGIAQRAAGWGDTVKVGCTHCHCGCNWRWDKAGDSRKMRVERGRRRGRVVLAGLNRGRPADGHEAVAQAAAAARDSGPSCQLQWHTPSWTRTASLEQHCWQQDLHRPPARCNRAQYHQKRSTACTCPTFVHQRPRKAALLSRHFVAPVGPPVHWGQRGAGEGGEGG